MYKSLLIRSIAIGFIVTSGIVAIGMPQAINADLKHLAVAATPATLVANGHLTITKLDKSSYQVVKTVKMIVTAYSSSPNQTDDTPFINASGQHVKDGDIAINGLPFGTQVRIPSLYGDKIFTVQDRMHPRMGTKHADIWFPEYIQAKNFGAKYNVNIEIVES